jgi:hypothetical protein
MKGRVEVVLPKKNPDETTAAPVVKTEGAPEKPEQKKPEEMTARDKYAALPPREKLMHLVRLKDPQRFELWQQLLEIMPDVPKVEDLEIMLSKSIAPLIDDGVKTAMEGFKGELEADAKKIFNDTEATLKAADAKVKTAIEAAIKTALDAAVNAAVVTAVETAKPEFLKAATEAAAAAVKASKK